MIDHETAGPGASPVPASDWNPVVFAAGERLLRDWVATETVAAHVVEFWSRALAAVAGEAELRTEQGRWFLLSHRATAHPFSLGVRPGVHAALYAVFAWGTRRAARDRRVRASLPDVLRAVAEARAELAGVAGADPASVRAEERAAQDADIARVGL